MAFVDSSASTFKIDDAAGTLRTLTTYVDTVDGLPGGRELSDVTALSDSGHRFIPTIPNNKFTINGNYDPTATTGPHVVLSGLLTATATASFEYGPEGTTAGKPKLMGECWCTSFVETSKVGSQITFKCDLQVDGVVTVTTY
jgi:hypothetical protein